MMPEKVYSISSVRSISNIIVLKHHTLSCLNNSRFMLLRSNIVFSLDFTCCNIY